jgi:endonuclease YncB( thermonuclease family)
LARCGAARAWIAAKIPGFRPADAGHFLETDIITRIRRIATSRTLITSLAAAVAAGLTYLASAREPAAPVAPAGHGAYELQGTVVRVIDGDTIALRSNGGERRIRLASIDAPEISHGSDRPGQPFGQASRRNLAELIAGKSLTVHCYERDQYGRDVCDLPGGQGGHTANWAQVQAGFAWANTVRHGEYLRDPSLRDVQREAQAAHRGLWAAAGAVAPWQWRYDCWRQHRCERGAAGAD